MFSQVLSVKIWYAKFQPHSINWEEIKTIWKFKFFVLDWKFGKILSFWPLNLWTFQDSIKKGHSAFLIVDSFHIGQHRTLQTSRCHIFWTNHPFELKFSGFSYLIYIFHLCKNWWAWWHNSRHFKTSLWIQPVGINLFSSWTFHTSTIP